MGNKRILTEEQKEKKRIRDRKYKEKNKERWRRWKLKHTKGKPNIKKERKNENERKKIYHSTKKGRAVNLCSNYRYSDKKYNRGECTLTPEWIVENIFNGQKCYYCGESDWTKLGADRIDNNKPHTLDNVVPCCLKCNNKKQKKSFEEFVKNWGYVHLTSPNHQSFTTR